MKFFKIIGFFLLTVLALGFWTEKAHANYIDGNLVDDSKFINAEVMSQIDIQNFLNSKGGALATQTFSTNGIGDDHGNQTAAWIIAYVARHIGISPRTIMATLQKEQSLITDPSPIASQYNYAMGYGCPDSGGCSYPGFFNQVLNGSWQLRFDYERAGGNTGTWTSPDGSTWGHASYPCPSATRYYSTGLYSGNTVTFYDYAGTAYKTFKLTNRATAALYCYTPHAYPGSLQYYYSGSYNFVISWEYWWGETTGNGLIQVANNPNVYLEWGDTYYLFPDYQTYLAYGMAGKSVAIVDQAYLSSATRGPDLKRVVQYGQDPSIYLIDNGVRHKFPDWATYIAFGYDEHSFTNYSNPNLTSLLSSGSSMSTIVRNPEGKIYNVASGSKHYLPSDTYYTAGSPVYSSRPYVNLSTNYLITIPEGIPLIIENDFIKSADNPNIYFYNEGSKYLFSTYNAWVSWGKKISVLNLPGTAMSLIPDGANISMFFSDSNGNYYLADSGKAHIIDPAQITAWGKTIVDFISLPDSVISFLSRAPSIANVVKGSNANIYLMKNGKAMLFPDWSDLTRLGYTSSNIISIANVTLNMFPKGSPAYAPGSKLLFSNGKIYWIDSDFKALYVPDMNVYIQYWPSFNGLRQQATANLNDYQNQNLKILVKSSSNDYYLIDSTTKHYVSNTMYSPSYYNFGVQPSITLSDLLLNSLSNGGNLLRDVKGSSPAIYQIQNGLKRKYTSPQAFISNGGNWGQVLRLSDTYLSSIPNGLDIN